MSRTAGSKNRTIEERIAAHEAETKRLRATLEAENHPWLASYVDVLNALNAACEAEVPEGLLESQNTLRAALTTIRVVGRESDIEAVRTLLGE
jgi:hypothetical protein